jgi:hypothetical protein
MGAEELAKDQKRKEAVKLETEPFLTILLVDSKKSVSLGDILLKTTF